MPRFFKKLPTRVPAYLVCFLLMGLGLAPNRSMAGTTAVIASDPAMGNPYEVSAGQASTLNYQLTYKLGPNSEGVTPSVKSVVATFSVDNGRTIVQTGTSTYTEALEPGPSPMSLSCTAEGPKDGSYGVTCAVTVKLSDGESIDAGSAVDSFIVSAITVNISGPPYAIFDNSVPYDNAPVESQYTASVGGEPAGVQLSYQWQVSGNINDLSSGAVSPPNSIETDGALSSPTGSPGLVSCAVYQGVYPFISNGQTGEKQVTVHNEYVVTTDPTKTQKDGVTQPLGPVFTVNPPGGTSSITQGSSYSVSVTEGLDVSASAGLTDFIEASTSASVSSTQNWTWTQAITDTQTLAPGSWRWWQTPVMEVESGTAQQWGVNGEISTVPWSDPMPSTVDLQVLPVVSPT